ncbi:MAG: PAS domain S-box protein, partial [Flavitalea sp.]
LHEIESFMRDFTLKPEQTYLDGIDRLSDSVASNMRTLFQLTEDNKIQKGRLDSLTYLLAYDAGNRNTSIARKRDTSNSHVITAEMLFAEQITKTRIREVIYRIQEEETRLLSGRSLQTMKTVNGSQRIIKVIGVLVFGMLLVMFLVIYRNTVSRNAAEAALRKNEKFIRSIIDNTSSTISIKDTEGRFMLVNKQGENFIGKKESELIGKTMFDLVPFENAVEGEAYDKAAMEAGKLVEFEVQTPDSLGGKYYLSSRFPLFDENNKVYAVCSMSTDISWVKAAQAEVEKASRLQQHMLNNLQYLTEASADVICIADEDGIYRQISANCKHLFGYEADEMIGHHFADFILEEDKQPSIDHRTVLFSEMLTTGYENRIVRKDGVVVPLMWTNVWSEETRLVYSIIKDATEKKMTARQLADLNESLKKRASELQASNTELERFAYVASHDLQEPLRMVSSFLQLLEKKLEGTLDETGRKYIAFAVDGAERMKTLIQDLLQYSRIGTSKELVVNVDLNDVLKTVASFYSLAISETDAELHISQMPVIKAEKAQMQQLFQNLVGNAIKYSKPKKPIVTVGYEEEPEHWLFFVKDQGIGISPKFYEKIFIIFQRLHTKTEYSGTGIGLAICKKIVERHGGTIWVESELELGTTFFVRLPKY